MANQPNDLQMKKRVVTALIGIPSIVLCMLVGFPLFEVLVIGAAILSAIELIRLIKPIHNSLYLLIGAIYIGIPMGLIYDLRYANNGIWWLVILFTMNWTTDAMALFGGLYFGNHKLAPRISPSKTVEGALIGWIGGAIIGFVMLIGQTLPTASIILISIVLPCLTILGDLVESAAKRYFGVKDTGTLLPGHGGLIDRLDGIYLATPFFYGVLLLTDSL